MKTIIELPTNLSQALLNQLITTSGITVTEIIHDGAGNLDSFGKAQGIPVRHFDRKKFEQHGAAADEFNERAMIESAEALIAVASKYNKRLIANAQRAGLKVFVAQ